MEQPQQQQEAPATFESIGAINQKQLDEMKQLAVQKQSATFSQQMTPQEARYQELVNMRNAGLGANVQAPVQRPRVGLGLN